MANTTAAKRLNKSLARIQQLANIFGMPSVETKIIEQLFTPEEGEIVLANPVPIGSAIQAWAAKRGISEDAAVVEVARHMNLISKGEEFQLLREIGEHADAVLDVKRNHGPKAPDRPVWDHDQGTLSYQGEKVFLNVTKAKNLCRVLDRFEESGWSSGISNPLTSMNNSQQLRDTAYTLNRKIAFLRFSVIDGGRRITWKYR